MKRLNRPRGFSIHVKLRRECKDPEIPMSHQSATSHARLETSMAIYPAEISFNCDETTFKPVFAARRPFGCYGSHKPNRRESDSSPHWRGRRQENLLALLAAKK
jgi:hypothetical protein